MNQPHVTNNPGVRTAGWLLVGICLAWSAGLAINVLLLGQTYSAAEAGGLRLPGCTAAGSPCDVVLGHPASRVFGIALTLWGLEFYAVATLTLVVLRWTPSLAGALLLAVVASAGAVTGVWLFIVMRTQIGSYCPWCVALHACNLIAFVLAVGRVQTLWDVQQKQRRETGQPASSKRPIVGAVAAGGLVASVTLTMLAWGAGQATLTILPFEAGQPTFAELLFASEQPAGSRPAEISTILGDPNSTHRVVLFSCFTCSQCRLVHGFLEQLLARPGANFCVEVRMAPLDPACNPAWPPGKASPEHERACATAETALGVAAAAPAAFAEFAEWLFGHQGKLTEAALAAEAARIADASEVDAVAEGDSANDQVGRSALVQQRLANDVHLTQRLGIKAVPRLVLPTGVVQGTFTTKNLAELLAREFGELLKD